MESKIITGQIKLKSAARIIAGIALRILNKNTRPPEAGTATGSGRTEPGDK